MCSPPGKAPGHEGRVNATRETLDRQQELRVLAPRLVALEVWCRTNGLHDLAEDLESLVDRVDGELTRRQLVADLPSGPAAT